MSEAYVREGRGWLTVTNLTRAEQSGREIDDGAFAVRMDVTDRESIDAAVSEVSSRVGGLDILVSNAAVFDLAPIVEITREL